MMSFTDWTGLSGLALVWVLLVLRLSIISRLRMSKSILLIAATYGLVMLPVFDLSLAGWLRGMVGDLSITSVLLLAAALLLRLRRLAGGQAESGWDARNRYSLLLFLSVLAVLLYPFALGIGILDPYRSGFGSIGFILILALLSLWALRRGLVLLPLAIALAVIAWSLNWYESTNLWDYLIDVPLAVYAICVLLKTLLLIIVRRGKRA